jgi:hypothetical protein
MTMTMTDRLEQGFRDTSTIHDIDGARHQVVIDWPIAVDNHGTDFGPGAFEGGWRRDGPPPMCLEHNKEKVIGRAEHTESLPDRHRVIARFSNFAHNRDAEAAWSNIGDGNYRGASFHFVDGRSISHPTVRNAKRFTSARMLEFGPVVAPSCKTEFSGFRSLPEADYYLEDDPLAGELEYAIDECRYHLGDLRRDGKIPPTKCAQIAANLAHSAETMGRLRNRGVPVGSGRRSIGSVENELAERFRRLDGRRYETLQPGFSTIAQQLAIKGVQQPVTRPYKYSSTDEDRESLYDALTSLLVEAAEVVNAAELPDGVKKTVIGLAGDHLASPTSATGADLAAALDAVAPHLPPVQRAKLQGLGVQIKLATSLMQPFQRLAVQGVLGKN